MSLPRLRSHLKMLAPCLRKFGNPDFLFKTSKHPNEYFLTRPRLVKIKIPFLNSAIGFSAENPNGYLGSPKGCFWFKTAKSVFEANITSACPRARYTPPRIRAYTHARAQYARPRTYAYARRDYLKGQFRKSLRDFWA